MKTPKIKSLYYITHIDNLPSILERGILSHNEVESGSIAFNPVYDSNIVQMRKGKLTPAGISLWEYANLYFQARNPMMYRVTQEQSKGNIAVVGVKPTVLESDGCLITDGNAANNNTEFLSRDDGLRRIEEQWRIIQAKYWTGESGSKRKIMAECLVPKRIDPALIHSVYVVNHEARTRAEKSIGNSGIPIVPESDMFFQPKFSRRIGKNLSVIDGDMFFSGMQTLTVSVNLQGVMGKGLASRAKYQFPDVYVDYQDACRAKKLTARNPYLYKREASLDQELADLSAPLSTPNSVKWFLFFATKRHWRDDSRVEDIEAGLKWIRENYKQTGIKSLAMPALGCGLGGLPWEEIGPLMCRQMHGIDIPVAIYLPQERKIEERYLSQEYLIRQ